MAYKINFAQGGLLGITNATINTINADHTITNAELVNTRILSVEGSGDYTITLPTADLEDGTTIRFIYKATGVVTLDGVTLNIESTSTRVLDKDIDLIYNGSGWDIFNASIETSVNAEQVERYTGQPVPSVAAGDNIKFWTGSETDYDLITTKDPSTLYILTS